MNADLPIFATIAFSLKRMSTRPVLALSLLAGLALAAALAVAVPLYAEGVNNRLLQAELQGAAQASRRPPFSFLFHYVGSWYGALEPEQYAPADRYLREEAAGQIGLRGGAVTRYVATGNLQLHPPGETIRRGRQLETVRLAGVSGLLVAGEAGPIRLTAGRLPRPVGAGEPLEALVSLALANAVGLQAGETYQLYRPGGAGTPVFRAPVRVAGVWVPDDPQDEFWFNPPESFDQKLIIPEETFFGPLAEALDRPVNEAIWLIALDGSGLSSRQAAGLLRRIAAVQTRANALLPHTDLEASPVQALRQYRRQAVSLTGLLFIFSAPPLGLALIFLGLAAAMLVQAQRAEIAVLRSRGASRRWVAGTYLAEWSLLGGAGLAAGLPGGLGIARLVGRTQSFLDFSRPASLPVRLTPEALGCGLLAVGLALLCCLVPVWGAGGHTVVSYKQELARTRGRPLVQRMYLDLCLLLPCLYGLYTLRAGARSAPLGLTLEGGDPFQNPVLFLLPTLFCAGLSLLLARLLPRLLSGLAALSAGLPGSVPVLALRQLARSPGDHRGPLLLMVLTLSLAGFVASMARTLDRALVDRVYYEFGADLNLVESGEFVDERTGAPIGPGGQGVWNFLPLSDHLALPGVEAAARVGKYPAELQAGGRSAAGRLVGIDRAEFPGVAYFRPDFAGEPLPTLLDRLVYDPAALLVDRDSWGRLHLNVGDPVTLEIRLQDGQRREVPFKAAGPLDLFPTLYPQDGPFFIANLEYIFESVGGLQPYDVWLRTRPGTDPQAIVTGLNNLGVMVTRAQDARGTAAAGAEAPERQGALGLLSVGFLAALALTAAGFFLYALFSFRARFIQLGVLRAIGLSARQMAAALALEQLILILIGLAGGSGIAVLAARLFIPHLPAGGGGVPGAPPLVVEIAWDDLARVALIFSGMLLAGVAATVLSLRRLKLFQAVKLGETV